MRRFIRWFLAPLLALVLLAAGFWVAFPQAARTVLGRCVLQYISLRSGGGWLRGGFTVRENVMVPMRDGVRLATDLYLPQGAGRHPAILVRTPYSKAEGRMVAEFLAPHGYAVLVQDTRGKHKSEGAFYPFRDEGPDGADFSAWVKRQPWCNGKIGGFGFSYLGITQWAMAVGNPDVSSIAPTFTTQNPYHSIYRAGAFSELTFLHWSLSSYGRFGNWIAPKDVERGYRHFPLAEADDAAARDIDFYNDWVRHPEPDAYWRGVSYDHRIGEIRAPAFLVAGWFDLFRDAQFRDFQLIRNGAAEPARSRTRMLVGPWSHGFFNDNLKNYGIQPRWLEAIPFEYLRETKAWLDYTLKGASNGWERRAAVRAFVLGDNEWRDEEDWPPRGTHDRQFYLRAGGGLDASAPGAEAGDRFVFDPRNPVPTRGGSHGDRWLAGPADQREIEKRKDVLVYSTAPLAEPLLVMGPVKMRLFASSSAPDTDFTAKLVDVFEDGRALILTEGIVRARYRNGLDRPEPMRPGAVYPFDIDMGHTAVRFGAGHRIRLEVSSSNAPRFDVNPNTGRPIANERNPVTAEQTVLHREGAASCLILPVAGRQ